jgi:drug/metabolite transporter (DMT)-like permease
VNIDDLCCCYGYLITNERGMMLVYIFVGCLILEFHVLRTIAGAIVGLVGVGYVALEFVPSIEPPANMREADPSWGSEQV